MRATKKLTILISLCLILTVFLSIFLIGCNSLLTNIPKKSQSQTPTSFVSIDINPSIELILDQNGVVMSIAGTNHDGKVLLFDEDGIVGSSLDVAMSNITALAVKYGYLTEDNDTVSASVVSSDDSKSIVQTLENSIQRVAKDTQLTLSLKQEVNLSLQEELSALKKEYSDHPDIQSMDIAHLCLAKRAQHSEESLVEVCSKSLDELLLRVNEVQSDAMSKFDNSYSTQVESAQYLFDSACSILQNGLQVCFYYKNYIDNADLLDFQSMQKVRVSLQYTLAQATKLALEYFDTCLNLDSVNARYYLDKDSVQAIADKLNTSYDEIISKTHASLQDDVIAIDEQDLKSYINTLYRNADSAMAQNIQNAYSSIEAILNSSLSMVDGHDGAVEFLAETLESILSSSPLSTLSDIADKYASQIATFIGDYFPKDLDISSKESIKSAISQLDDKIKSLEEKLPDDDTQAFTQYCEENELAQNIAKFRDRLTNKLANLKQDAITALSEEKASRLYARQKNTENLAENA